MSLPFSVGPIRLTQVTISYLPPKGVESFIGQRTTDFEGYSGMLVFYTFMPLGALSGGLGGAILWGMIGAKR